MTKEQEHILKLKKDDPLSIAENITGRSYKEDDDTSTLGFLLHMQKGEQMRRMLDAAGDTQFSSSVKDYLNVTGNFGFKVVYIEPFATDRGEENLYVLFHPELSILIYFDTFTWEGSEPNVNGGNMCYNWSPNNFNNSLTSSGHYFFEKDAPHMCLFEKDFSTRYRINDFPTNVKWDMNNMTWEEFKKINGPIDEEQKKLFDSAVALGKRFLWIGSHDCREGIITTIKAMFENGKFFPVWQDCPFSWITNYMEHKKGYDFPYTEHKNVTIERISKMPENVRKCINNTYKG